MANVKRKDEQPVESQEATEAELQQLQACLQELRRISQGYVPFGKMLAQLRDSGIAEKIYGSWAKFLSLELDNMSKRRAAEIIEASKVGSQLQDDGENSIPNSVRKAQLLSKLPPEQQTSAWQQAMDDSQSLNPDYQVIKDTVDKIWKTLPAKSGKNLQKKTSGSAARNSAQKTSSSGTASTAGGSASSVETETYSGGEEPTVNQGGAYPGASSEHGGGYTGDEKGGPAQEVAGDGQGEEEPPEGADEEDEQPEADMRSPLERAAAEAAPLRQWMQQLSHLKQEITQWVDRNPVAHKVALQEVQTGLLNARRGLDAGVPAHDCPYCGHEEGCTDCNACHGRAWVTESVYRAVPAEIKGE